MYRGRGKRELPAPAAVRRSCACARRLSSRPPALGRAACPGGLSGGSAALRTPVTISPPAPRLPSPPSCRVTLSSGSESPEASGGGSPRRGAGHVLSPVRSGGADGRRRPRRRSRGDRGQCRLTPFATSPCGRDRGASPAAARAPPLLSAPRMPLPPPRS